MKERERKSGSTICPRMGNWTLLKTMNMGDEWFLNDFTMNMGDEWCLNHFKFTSPKVVSIKEASTNRKTDIVSGSSILRHRYLKQRRKNPNSNVPSQVKLCFLSLWQIHRRLFWSERITLKHSNSSSHALLILTKGSVPKHLLRLRPKLWMGGGQKS